MIKFAESYCLITYVLAGMLAFHSLLKNYWKIANISRSFPSSIGNCFQKNKNSSNNDFRKITFAWQLWYQFNCFVVFFLTFFILAIIQIFLACLIIFIKSFFVSNIINFLKFVTYSTFIRLISIFALFFDKFFMFFIFIEFCLQTSFFDSLYHYLFYFFHCKTIICQDQRCQNLLK